MIFCGVDTSICLETSLRDALKLGFDVLVISEATASMNPTRYGCTLDDVSSFYGLVLDTGISRQPFPDFHLYLKAMAPTLVLINPLQIVLWTFRRNEHDVINLYNSLSPVMQLATGGDMLNFGYWDKTSDPITAQNDLCSLVGRMADLSTAKRLVDVGSGLSAPAALWKSTHDSLDINCLNVNFQQLLAARKTRVSLLNATSTILPFSDSSVDRIVALESAQHFRPLGRFLTESRRVLERGGVLVVAIPVMVRAHSFFKLGILSWTWSSEHYELEYVKSLIEGRGFEITDVKHIGHQVYEPLADYYVRNRSDLRERITQKYPAFLESILYKSLLKMSEVSRKEIIDYVIIKAVTQR